MKSERRVGRCGSCSGQTVMIGTDYPFEIFERDPLGRLRETGLRDATVALLQDANARRFLGLPSQ